MIRIEVPNITSAPSGFAELAKLAYIVRDYCQEDIFLDFECCKHLNGNMTAPLKMLAESMVANKNRVFLNNMGKDVEKVLYRSHFFQRKDLLPSDDEEDNSLPAEYFDNNDNLGFWRYVGKMVEMIDQPKMTPALTKEFTRSIMEIFENAKEHAKSRMGVYACAHYFSDAKKFKFTISDAGIGFRENVNAYNDFGYSDAEAIFWAMQESNTTKRGDSPGGLGLKFIKEFVNLNKGRLTIVSGDGVYDFLNEQEHQETIEYSLPGASVNLEIDTSDTNSYCLTSEK